MDVGGVAIFRAQETNKRHEGSSRSRLLRAVPRSGGRGVTAAQGLPRLSETNFENGNYSGV